VIWVSIGAVCRDQGCLRGRHKGAAGWAFEGAASQGFVRGPDRPQRSYGNGLAHVPAGTSRFDECRGHEHGYSMVRLMAWWGSNGVPDFHMAWSTHRHLTGQRSSGAFKAEPLPQYKAPTAKRARLRHIAGIAWSTKRYLNVDLLKDQQMRGAITA
jgi:hypothetical protein